MTVVAHPTILDAARRVFEQYGARRANVEDVARAAGVSRSTLYRAYPNKEALLEAVLVAEFDAFLTELDRVAADLPPHEAVVECFARGMSLTREIPLLARLTETEPELVTAAGAASHTALVLRSAERVAATLRRAGATMPDDDLETAGRAHAARGLDLPAQPARPSRRHGRATGARLRAALPRPPRALRHGCLGPSRQDVVLPQGTGPARSPRGPG